MTPAVAASVAPENWTRQGRFVTASVRVPEFPDDIAADPEKWKDPTNWWMVTPNRGRSVMVERIIEDYQAAKDTSEEERRHWASQHLNVEIGMARRSDRWVGCDYWEQCGDSAVTLDALLERCEVIVCGIDGGGLDDLLGFAAIGREKVTRNWLHYGRAWAYPGALDRRKSIAPALRDFKKAGDMTIVGMVSAMISRKTGLDH